MSSPSSFTASSIFLRTLSRAGVTHAFVNWGSDHPALLEDLERQRVVSPTGSTSPVVVTCPNEMVALSAAQGFAQATGNIAAVIVHVDVGTQVRLFACRIVVHFNNAAIGIRHWRERCIMLTGAGHLCLSTRERHLSVRTGSTREHGMSGSCGFKVLASPSSYGYRLTPICVKQTSLTKRQLSDSICDILLKYRPRRPSKKA